MLGEQDNRNKVVKVRTAKTRKLSSNKWLFRQLNDPYVTKAKSEGYRSRAAYKLLEINQKFKLFTPQSTVVDLGSAPGSWSQVVAKTSKNTIIALDILEMDSIPNVTFIHKDFLDENAGEMIKNTLNGKEVDLVLSDMAANTTGHTSTDHIRTLYLCETALDFALTILKQGGHFVAKVLRGGTERDLLIKIKNNFKVVKHFKPNSSRKESKEYYLIALNRKTSF